MTKAEAQRKLFQAERANPKWDFWLEYDPQFGWTLNGDPRRMIDIELVGDQIELPLAA